MIIISALLVVAAILTARPILAELDLTPPKLIVHRMTWGQDGLEIVSAR